MKKKTAKDYIISALRQEMEKHCKGYGPSTIEAVIKASTDKGFHVSKELLLLALKLAVEDVNNQELQR